MVLQQKKKVTAPFLAERFEVSRRTIQRDIEDLCQAGIPVVTTQGAEGGIALMEGFQLDTASLTPEELRAIFAGLRSLDSVSRTSQRDRLAKRFSGGGETVCTADNLFIDLSSFYKDSLSEKIELLQEAMEQGRMVSFQYYYSKGRADKVIEPYRILFKWSDWYVLGFCSQRQDFRVYKLNRLWNLQLTWQTFQPREIPKEKEEIGGHLTDDYPVSALYSPTLEYRLVETYGPNCYIRREDGRLFATLGFTGPDRAMEWFLSFGSQVEVVDPPELREKLRETAEKLQELYR